MQGSFKAVLATMLLVGLAAREAAYADEPTCQQLDRAVVERVLIAANAARARYAQALDELLGLPPALADASLSDADAP